jgi:hypothetical protein
MPYTPLCETAVLLEAPHDADTQHPDGLAEPGKLDL